jgi:hypothetical protein
VYSELDSKEGRFKGYVKPLLHDLKILRWKDEQEGFFHKLWEGVVEVGKGILENDDKQQVATRIPLSSRHCTAAWSRRWATRASRAATSDHSSVCSTASFLSLNCSSSCADCSPNTRLPSRKYSTSSSCTCCCTSFTSCSKRWFHSGSSNVIS